MLFAKDISVSKKLWNINFSNQDKKTIQNIFKNIENKKYQKSLILSRKFHNSLFTDAFRAIIDRKRILELDLEESLIFSEEYPFFSEDVTNERIERNIVNAKLEYLEIKEKYPKYYKSKNKFFKIYLIQEKTKFYQETKNIEDQFYFIENDIKKRVIDVWISNDFTDSGREEFLDIYGYLLEEEDHVTKIKNLFLENKYSQAKKIFDYISEDYRRLFNGIIKIKKKPNNIRRILLSIPRKHRFDELLLYHKAKWLRSNKEDDKVVDLLLDLPQGASYKNYWWKLRKLYSRELLKDKKSWSYKKAYKIVANHGLKKGGAKYADAEWTAGWIALRFLDNPDDAYEHFSNLYNNVNYPISISRAAYWLAESSLEENQNRALYWYQVAMRYPTYFYGQVARSKYKKLKQYESSVDIFLPADPVFNKNNIKSLKNNIALKTAILFAINEQTDNAEYILKYLTNIINDKGDIALIVELITEIGNNKLTHKILKNLTGKNIFFINKQFRIVKEVKNPNKALIHSLIKQESAFSQSAVSSVGALGFMQLMPYTAKKVAKEMKLRYSSKKLKRDRKYNIKLGSYYINSLLQKFDNSKIMAIASYNAGPNAVKRWINDFYDPRETQDINEIIDWIELITYSETRNYVQRIMENLTIYEYLLSKK